MLPTKEEEEKVCKTTTEARSHADFRFDSCSLRSDGSSGNLPTRTALTNPQPPADNDKVDKTCVAAEACGVPKISRRHAQTFVMSSGKLFCVFWSDCAQPEVCPGGATHGQETQIGCR